MKKIYICIATCKQNNAIYSKHFIILSQKMIEEILEEWGHFVAWVRHAAHNTVRAHESMWCSMNLCKRKQNTPIERLKKFYDQSRDYQGVFEYILHYIHAYQPELLCNSSYLCAPFWANLWALRFPTLQSFST